MSTPTPVDDATTGAGAGAPAATPLVSGGSELGGRPAAWSGPARWVVALGVVAGVVLRAAVLLGPLGRPDSDEVLAGLMARHLWSDGLPAFLWGQHYGGTVQVVPVALSVELLGSSVPAMRVPTLVLAAVNAVLVWRCARRLVPSGAATTAGLVAWVWPAAAVWFGTREQLFYVPTVTLGLAAVLFALRIAGWGLAAAPAPARTGPRVALDWALLGLVLGVGWWTSPNVAYFAIAAVVALLWPPGRTTRVSWPPARGAALAAGGMLLGALPWLVSNAGSGFGSLRDSSGFRSTGSYPERLGWFFSHGLPGELGVRDLGTFAWVGGPLGVALEVAALGLLVVALARAVARPGRAGADRARVVVGPDAVGLVAFPMLFAAIPFAMEQPNLRYVFFAVPFLVMVAARLVTGPRLAAAVVVGAVVVSGLGLVRIQTTSEAVGSDFRVGNVGSLAPAIAVLDDEGVDAVYADYWVAYRLAFETDERIVAEPSAGTERIPGYRDRVRSAGRVAWVVEAGDQVRALTDALDGLGVGYRSVAAGDLVVVIPDRNVTPDEVPNDARAPAGSEPLPPEGHAF